MPRSHQAEASFGVSDPPRMKILLAASLALAVNLLTLAARPQPDPTTWPRKLHALLLALIVALVRASGFAMPPGAPAVAAEPVPALTPAAAP